MEGVLGKRKKKQEKRKKGKLVKVVYLFILIFHLSGPTNFNYKIFPEQSAQKTNWICGCI